MTDDLQQLMKDSFPFYMSLSSQEKKLFNKSSTCFKYPAEKIIMEEGFTCNNSSFILRGSIRIYKLSEDGRQVTLYRVREGEVCLLTIACIMSDRSFPALARVEKETEMVALPAEVFQQLLQNNSSFQQFIFSKIFSRLQDVMLTLERVAFESIEKRTAGFLHQVFQKQKNRLIKITHAQIAGEIGTAREVVSRELKRLEEKNILHLSRGKIKILDPEALKKSASVI